MSFGAPRVMTHRETSIQSNWVGGTANPANPEESHR